MVKSKECEKCYYNFVHKCDYTTNDVSKCFARPTDIALYKIAGEIDSLCDTNKYFTNGTTSQYAKMHKMIEEDVQYSYISRAIWLCSDNADFCTIDRQVYDIYSREFNRIISETARG